MHCQRPPSCSRMTSAKSLQQQQRTIQCTCIMLLLNKLSLHFTSLHFTSLHLAVQSGDLCLAKLTKLTNSVVRTLRDNYGKSIVCQILCKSETRVRACVRACVRVSVNVRLQSGTTNFTWEKPLSASAEKAG